MSIPRDELGHYLDAAEQHPDNELDGRADPQAMEEARRTYLHDLMYMQSVCRKILLADPEGFAVIEHRCATMGINLDDLAYPASGFTLEQAALAKLAQRTLLDWIRFTATRHIPTEDISPIPQEAQGNG